MTVVLFCVAFVLVVAGVAVAYLPAGLVVAGALVGALGRFYYLGGEA